MSKRKGNKEQITLNVTAMLDMAFQLLAFFVFTFKSPPAEPQIRLKLPPFKPILGQGAANVGQKDIDPNQIKPVNSLVVSLTDADDNGGGHDGLLRGVTIALSNDKDSKKYVLPKDLEAELRDYVQKQGFEQLVLNVSPTLNWEEVMKVVDYCAKLPTKDGGLPSISFEAVGADQRKHRQAGRNGPARDQARFCHTRRTDCKQYAANVSRAPTTSPARPTRGTAGDDVFHAGDRGNDVCAVPRPGLLAKLRAQRRGRSVRARADWRSRDGRRPEVGFTRGERRR